MSSVATWSFWCEEGKSTKMELGQQVLLSTTDYFRMDKLVDVVSNYGDSSNMLMSMPALPVMSMPMSTLTIGLVCLAVTLSSVSFANKVLRQTIPWPKKLSKLLFLFCYCYKKLQIYFSIFVHEILIKSRRNFEPGNIICPWQIFWRLHSRVGRWEKGGSIQTHILSFHSQIRSNKYLNSNHGLNTHKNILGDFRICAGKCSIGFS